VVSVSTVSSLAAGVLFGLALAAPPGPMNAVIAEESVLRGWRAGVRAGAGAMLADASFFVLAWLGAAALVRRFPTARAVVVGAGGLLMCYFAYGAAREVGGSFRRDAGDAGTGDGRTGDGRGRSTGFRKALALALTNPYQILFWATIGVGLVDPGSVDVLAHTPYAGDGLAGLLVVETGGVALLTGFFGGIAAWIVVFPAALAGARRRVESLAPAVAGLSALVLSAFGVSFLLEAAHRLL